MIVMVGDHFLKSMNVRDCRKNVGFHHVLTVPRKDQNHVDFPRKVYRSPTGFPQGTEDVLEIIEIPSNSSGKLIDPICSGDRLRASEAPHGLAQVLAGDWQLNFGEDQWMDCLPIRILLSNIR
jgi:hypothetical protein